MTSLPAKTPTGSRPFNTALRAEARSLGKSQQFLDARDSWGGIWLLSLVRVCV